MIRREDVVMIGNTLKPHGLKGELTVELDSDCTLNQGDCIVLDIEGILVPFFIESVRRKNADALLIKVEGIDSDTAASEFSLKDIYILAADAGKCGVDIDDDDSILYLADMPGYLVVDTDGRVIGTIRSIDDTTINTLLNVEATDGQMMLIPFSEDFVADVDPVNKSMMLDLPDGILDLNKQGTRL